MSLDFFQRFAFNASFENCSSSFFRNSSRDSSRNSNRYFITNSSINTFPQGLHWKFPKEYLVDLFFPGFLQRFLKVFFSVVQAKVSSRILASFHEEIPLWFNSDILVCIFLEFRLRFPPKMPLWIYLRIHLVMHLEKNAKNFKILEIFQFFFRNLQRFLSFIFFIQIFLQGFLRFFKELFWFF